MTAPIRSIAPVTVDFTDYPSMIDAFRAIKDHIAISNLELDRLCNYGDGVTDKVLGPTGAKGLGMKTLDALLWGLAIRGTFTLDMERVTEMQAHWEQRCAANTRVVSNRISKKLVRAARPVVMKSMGQIGGMVTAHMRTAAQRSDSARKAAKSRWKKVRKNRVRCPA